MAVLLPVLLVLGLEIGLRVAGVGFAPVFFLEQHVNGQEVLTDNPRFGWRFFPPAIARTPEPVILPRRKAPDTTRIFVFGESAAMGDPEPAFGLSRQLEAMLRETFPEKKVEVVNVAMTAINSHVVREIARDCARREGDFWIIYMGNNEVVGPFGGGTVFGPQAPALSLIRGTLWFRSTRIGQLIGKQFRSGPEEWGGMEMFLQQQVRVDDPRLQTVHAHFRENLRDIVDLGVKSGAKVILSTMAVNRRDCPPFASLHAPGFLETNQWQKLFDDGAAAQSRGEATSAKELLVQAATKSDRHAELQYRLALACEATGEAARAREHFRLATEYDTLRFRADDAINASIKAVAKEKGNGVRLVNAEMALNARGSNQLAGRELFYEHVHFTFEGNYQLARAIFDEVAPLLGGETRRAPDAAACAQRLAWTDWDRLHVFTEVRKRLQQPPFTAQLGHSERDTEWGRTIDLLSERLNRGGLQRSIEEHVAALKVSGDDWVLREKLARALEEAGDLKPALEEWRKVAELLPHDPQAFFHVGNVADLLGHAEQATVFFRAALQRNPDLVEARNGLGLALSNLGRPEEAQQQFEMALRTRPTFTQARINFGQLLATRGQIEAAREQYELALRHDTNNATAHVNFGKLLADRGERSEAEKHYRAALRIDPRHAVAHFNLANALMTVAPDEALKHYGEASRWKPGFTEARYRYALQLAERNRVAEALPHFAAVVEQNPGFAEARFNHGVALAREKLYDRAIQEFRETLRLEPAHAQAREFLQRAETLRGQ